MLTLMSRMSASVLEQLEFIAHEIFETFANEGHLVGEALGQHQAFSAHGAESTASLTRDLVRDAARTAAYKLGVEYGPGRGSGREIAIIDGLRRLVFRLRSAEEADGGGFRILGSSDPFTGLECDALLSDEPWVFGFVRDRVLGGVAALMAARVVGLSTDAVPVLLLENVVRLTGGAGPTPGLFEGGDDDLEGFGGGVEDDDLGELGGAS